jgi:hypothetical protein
MEGNYIIACATAMIIVLLIVVAKPRESFSQNIRFQSISSGGPVPYDHYPVTFGDGHHIRRWRTPIPQTGTGEIGAPNWDESVAGLAEQVPTVPIVPRQVHDDVWARTYASGTGFQLG